MLRKLFCFLILLSFSYSAAADTKHYPKHSPKHHYPIYHHKHCYIPCYTPPPRKIHVVPVKIIHEKHFVPVPVYRDRPAPCHYFNTGPYVGLSVGGRNGFTNSNHNVSVYGVQAMFAAGYGGFLTPCFYLAGEGFVQYIIPLSNFKQIINGDIRNANTRFAYGASILPGTMLTENLLSYLRLGVVRSRFGNVGKQVNGAQIGLGGQVALTPCVDLRAEYVYSAYRKVVHIKNPRSNEVTLGLVYKFI